MGLRHARIEWQRDSLFADVFGYRKVPGFEAEPLLQQAHAMDGAVVHDAFNAGGSQRGQCIVTSHALEPDGEEMPRVDRVGSRLRQSYPGEIAEPLDIALGQGMATLEIASDTV